MVSFFGRVAFYGTGHCDIRPLRFRAAPVLTQIRVDGGIDIGKIRAEKKTVGYNAATGEVEDLMATGIIDATKVVRTALQNAASVAALMLTTDAVVGELPEPFAPGEQG